MTPHAIPPAANTYPEIARVYQGVGPLITEDCEEECGLALAELDALRPIIATAMQWRSLWLEPTTRAEAKQRDADILKVEQELVGLLTDLIDRAIGEAQS